MSDALDGQKGKRTLLKGHFQPLTRQFLVNYDWQFGKVPLLIGPDLCAFLANSSARVLLCVAPVC